MISRFKGFGELIDNYNIEQKEAWPLNEIFLTMISDDRWDKIIYHWHDLSCVLSILNAVLARIDVTRDDIFRMTWYYTTAWCADIM